MESAAVIFLLSLGVVAIAAVLFVAWTVAMMVRLVFRAFAALFLPASARRVDMRGCAFGDCAADNPVYARFCRRCGRSLDGRMGSGAVRVV